MRHSRPSRPIPRTWTVEILPASGSLAASCAQCGPLPATRHALHGVILSHLAQHARRDHCPAHLRTCQCGERGCTWHRRHRGCDGGLLLVLSRDKQGRRWRLADVCQACAAVIEHAAEVLEPSAAAGPPELVTDRAAASDGDAEWPSGWEEHPEEVLWWPADGA